MKYIQNVELREWVKESLRKTIFQKAHALSIQTGCDILVKLQDDTTDDDDHQYYATGSLHRAYNHNALHKHPKERLVSGETGLPVIEHVDQAVQSGDPVLGVQASDTDDLDQKIFTHGQDQFDTKDQQTTLPLHLTVSNEPPFGGETENQDTSSDERGESIQDIEQIQEGVQIKLEKEDTETQGTCMLSETADTNTQNTEPEAFSNFQDDLPMDTAGSIPTVSLQEEEPSGMGAFSMSPKPYQCAMCGKAFRSVQVLQKHTQTFHFRGQGSHGLSRGRGRGHNTSVKRYQCVMCSRSFPHPDLLQDHMSRSHMSPEAQQLASQQSSQAMFPPNNSTATSSSSATLGSQPQGPFHLTDSPGESQPSTSGVVLPQSSWSVPASSSPFTQQRRKLGGGSSYRYPHVGRPLGSGSIASPAKSPATTPKTDGEFRKSFWQRGSTSFEIMRSLLRCTGPISTYTAFTQSGPPRLRSISKQAYNGAAEELQTANLGMLISLDREGLISTPGRSPVVFIKSPPEVAGPILAAGLMDMCSPDEYARKFSNKVPAKISKATRQKLIALGYVTAVQMEVSNSKSKPPPKIESTGDTG